MDTDEALKGMARESVKQGENLRSAVRELTLNALRSRELSLAEIKRVLKTVTEGVNLGVAGQKIDAERAISDALAGMDEAVLKAVQANHLALQQLASQGQSLRQGAGKKALDDLERLEDEFFKTVKDATKSGSKQLREQWATVLKQTQASGTLSASEIEATMEEFGERMREAVRQQRRQALKVAEVFSDNFTTLASGILIGITEGLEQGKADKSKT